MSRKKWKRNRAVLSLLLAGIMVVEPFGAASAVYAEEGGQQADASGPVWLEDEDGDESSAAGAEEAAENTGEGGEEPSDGNKEDASQNVGGGTEGIPSDAEEKTETPEHSSGIEEEENPEKEKPEEENPEEEKPEEEKSEDNQEAENPEEKSESDTEETISGNDLDEETVSENDLEEESRALNDFQGMPSDYILSSAQMESKRSLSAHMGEIRGFQEGKDYVEGQVVTQAESREEAEMIAEAYNAEIARYEFGILTLQLREDTPVEAALLAAADTERNLPAVWPNYYRYLMTDELTDDDGGIEIETEEYEPDGTRQSAEESAETAYLAVLSGNDPYLQPDSDYYQWHHNVIGSPYAWAEGYTGAGIKVAVLDSGVASHSDLPGVTDLGLANSGSADSDGHGTHVAGIIGARANGSLGVGVAPGVELYSGNLGSITTADIQAGLKAAIEKKVDLVNMSICGLGFVDGEKKLVDSAYNQGIAIFASSGNYGGATYLYPACYDHVISVAATDKNNERASFSSYSNLVDLSAPGVEIWSTDYTNASGYVAMSGTSMACPVAVGEAAVILSGNETLRNTQGGKRVDDLEKLMKKNATKAGSGMGAGITSLTKVFGLSTAAVKPNAPAIQITPDGVKDSKGNVAAQKVTVMITAQSGTEIYYTTNGKSPAFKNGEADAKAGTSKYTGAFEINNAAKATIKAIAVNESGVSSAVKSVTYKLNPYVTNIEISGLKKVAAGKSIQLAAAVTPSYATNKKVNWTLQDKDGKPLNAELAKKLKISSSGKVSAAKDTTPGTYQVVAAAKDEGQKKSAPYQIEVTAELSIKSVKFKTKNIPLVLSKTEKPTADLWQQITAETVAPEASASLTAADFSWSSNKTSVASVSAQGVVTPHQAGKATITALAGDSSGKKATVTITVTQLAESLTISAPATAKPGVAGNVSVIAKIAPGKSAAFRATAAPAWTSNKKVIWEIYDKSGKKIDAKEDKTFAKSVGVSINASGKVSAAKNAKPGIYTIRATAKDADPEKAAKAEAAVEVTQGMINSISFPAKADANVKLFRRTVVGTDQNVATVRAKIEGSTGADLNQYQVSSSNPGIAYVLSDSQSGGIITLTIQTGGKAAGKTKITIAATDGSGKKLTCNVTVVNPVSNITVAPSAGNNGAVAQGKSLQMKARVESEHGAISDKKVTWELYTIEVKNGVEAIGTKVDKALEESLGIKIASNGKVTAKADAALNSVETENGTSKRPMPYIVRATTKDGSGVYGEYRIAVGTGATWIYTCYDPTQKENAPSYDWNFISDYLPGCIDNPRIAQGLRAGGSYLYGVIGDAGQGGYTVSSSNPAVVSVLYDSSDYVDCGYLYLKAGKKGSATVTIKAMDGSGTQVKYKYVVLER